MFLKSAERVGLEDAIEKSLVRARREAIIWCIKHPLKGVALARYMNGATNISEDIIYELWSLPAGAEYRTSYDRLEELDREEGFPAMKYYAEQLDLLQALLPANATPNAYYPFAATDFYWGRIFDRIVFEDIGYDQELTKNMWWGPDHYQINWINRVASTLSEAGILDDNFSPDLITGDAEITRQDNDFNNSEWTLIIKGGHSIIPFLDDRFGENPINFTAIVIVKPADKSKKLLKGMSRRGYTCTHFEEGEDFLAPFAMSLKERYIFVKDAT